MSFVIQYLKETKIDTKMLDLSKIYVPTIDGTITALDHDHVVLNALNTYSNYDKLKITLLEDLISLCVSENAKCLCALEDAMKYVAGMPTSTNSGTISIFTHSEFVTINYSDTEPLPKTAEFMHDLHTSYCIFTHYFYNRLFM